MITDADREAARVWLVNTPAVEDWCGYEDQRALVQAFAAHRIAAMIEGARLMLSYASNQWLNDGDTYVGQDFGLWLRALDPATVIKEAE